MLVVALTGGIGAGKSTVAQCFAELGALVIDADQLARMVIERGTDWRQHVYYWPYFAIVWHHFDWIASETFYWWKDKWARHKTCIYPVRYCVR